MAAAAEWHAGYIGSRHRGARRRSGCCHLRPRLLGARSDGGVAADRREGAGDCFLKRLPVPAWRDFRDKEWRHEWHAAAARGAAGVESAVGSIGLLLAEDRARQAVEARAA